MLTKLINENEVILLVDFCFRSFDKETKHFIDLLVSGCGWEFNPDFDDILLALGSEVKTLHLGWRVSKFRFKGSACDVAGVGK
jgi:hypothetical protein